MIAEGIRARLHLVPAPGKSIPSSLTHTATPSAPKRLELARSGAARRRDEAAARRAGVVRVDGAHEVKVVLSAGERLGAAAAARVPGGIGAEVPVDNDVRGSSAGRNVVVVEVAVGAHCYDIALGVSDSGLGNETNVKLPEERDRSVEAPGPTQILVF